MYGKHRRKPPRFRVFRAASAFVLALVFSVFSFSTVMANTVSANVIDGDKSYTFSMDSDDLDRILAQAQRQGLESLGPLDVAEQVEDTTTVNIRRGVPITVVDGGKTMNMVAYRGDTIAKTLKDNNVLLREQDGTDPAPETVIEGRVTVTILRSSRVTVTADGESKTLTMAGGTVADALREAGVSLKETDSANYEADEALFDRMSIRVSRTVGITVTADGETKEYRVSAPTVRSALIKCGVALGEDDRLNVDLKAKPADGMEIVITRAETREVMEWEDIEFPVQYLTSDFMYEDEEELRTAGETGIRELIYKEVFIDGELTERTLISDEVTREPVPEVLVKGTLAREYEYVEYEPEIDEPEEVPNEGPAAGIVPGTDFTYVDVLTGSCTAYYPLNPGDITSTGVVAGYGCVAVDPNQIPYGTLMYIVSADGSVVYGYGVACDTGGFVGTGTLADLCYDTEPECSIIGRKDMVLYILRWGY